MDPTSKPSNKIREMVRLQEMRKKWKMLAIAPRSNSKSINFLKKTLSFSDTSSPSLAAAAGVPKGFLAVCVGEEMRRFVIPTDYLGHREFVELLREAEEEFGFEHEGVLRIPCEVSIFERTLKVVGKKKDSYFCCSSEADIAQTHHTHKPICR